MIKLDVSTRNYEADAKIKAYVQDKIGGLDKYLPRKTRQAAQLQVMLEDDPNGREDNHCVCEAILSLPGAQLVAKEGAINIYAAVDIVEAKMKAQVRTYKDKYQARPRRSKLLARVLGQRAENDAAPVEPSL